MRYQMSILALAALFSSTHCHSIIVSAVGESGESQGFKADSALARNCTNISPCQQDSTIIRDSEIKQNIVNSCGRTEIDGNIDVGGETEKELAANRVTSVQRGSTLAVTFHQVNADGAGPYECDLDQTSNAATNFVPLTVSNNVPGTNGLSQAEAQEFTINVQMPEDFNCIGASTGDVCTVRCRNNAVAGPFGGCFAVQQTDGIGRPDSSAGAVDTAQTLEAINAQIAQNQKDLPAAIAANQAAGAASGNVGASIISALIPGATAAPDAGNGGNANNGNGGNRNNGNAGNAGNGNGNAGNVNNGNTGNGNTNNGNAGNGNFGNGRGNGQGNGRNRNNNNRRSKFLTRFMG